MEKWNGKIAIVTGASSGIGNAIVRDFVKYGITTVALARRLERLEALKQELRNVKGKVIPIKCDVSDKASIEAAFEEINKIFGVAHILVNNAGVSIHSSMLGDEEQAEEAFTQTINTNFLGLVRVTRKAYKLMKKSDDYGMIINIGSIGGHNNSYTEFHTNVYRATKYAVRAVSESMRHELVKFNDLKIRVCELSPGAVETELPVAGGWSTGLGKYPVLKSTELSQAVLSVMMLPYNVNVSQMIVRPVGEKF